MSIIKQLISHIKISENALKINNDEHTINTN
jgi:hypothetical protein